MKGREKRGEFRCLDVQYAEVYDVVINAIETTETFDGTLMNEKPLQFAIDGGRIARHGKTARIGSYWWKLMWICTGLYLCDRMITRLSTLPRL